MRDIDQIDDTEPQEVLVLLHDPLSRDGRRHVNGVFGNKTALYSFVSEHVHQSSRPFYSVTREIVRHE